MRGFTGLTKRNLMLYFKDFGAVCFSLLTSIIVFVLYLIFLKGTFVDAIEGCLHGLEDRIHAEDVELLVNMLLLVGIVGSALITIPYSCLATLIRDKENKIDFDILSTPIRRWQIIVSYFLSAVISSFIVTGVILSVGLLMINGTQQLPFTARDIVTAYGMVFVGSTSSTAIFLILAMFFKSSASSSAFFGILSAASGFMIGAYIPLSQFSDKIQTVCNLFPATQITVLLRRTLMDPILKQLNEKIGGVDQGAFAKSIRRIFNFTSVLFGNTLNTKEMVVYISCFFIGSMLVMIFVYSKTYKRR